MSCVRASGDLASDYTMMSSLDDSDDGGNQPTTTNNDNGIDCI